MATIAGDEGTENWTADLPGGNTRKFFADRIFIDAEDNGRRTPIFYREGNVTFALLPFGTIATRL